VSTESQTILDRILCDPETGQQLARREDAYYRSDGKRFPIKDGIASLVFPESLAGADLRWNRFYNHLVPFYDFIQRVLGKLITGVDSTTAWRDVLAHLPFEPGSRLLEVSPGPGVFQRLLRQRIGEHGELVALDLSLNMLRQCRKRGDPAALLVHGNGQYLPFAEDSFDGLFHFGGVNLFNDPNKAIAEFIRVVRRNGIVSWGDEGFAPNYKGGDFKKKVLARLNPGYLKARPPIPETLADVTTQEVFGGLGYLVVGRKK
jgi:ubiquinone/menaquinone biosynthesis C-methylase UbiE